MNYQFEAVKDETEIAKWELGSKICDIYDFSQFISELEEKHILAFGQLKNRFGEPYYITENLENQYQYYILATDQEGKKFFLNAYSGPSGPSIGGNTSDQEVVGAANALAAYIRESDADDYDYTGYYLDAMTKINCGIKDGVVYNSEEELDLSEDELKDLFNRVYDL